MDDNEVFHHAWWTSSLCLHSAEPVRPIDPAAWISHTTALTGPYTHYGEDKSTSRSPHILPVMWHFHILISVFFFHNLLEYDDLPLSASKTDMATIVKVMQLPDSGLEIRDRMWLKITIANAVIGEKSCAGKTVFQIDQNWPFSHVISSSGGCKHTQISAFVLIGGSNCLLW